MTDRIMRPVLSRLANPKMLRECSYPELVAVCRSLQQLGVPVPHDTKRHLAKALAMALPVTNGGEGLLKLPDCVGLVASCAGSLPQAVEYKLSHLKDQATVAHQLAALDVYGRCSWTRRSSLAKVVRPLLAQTGTVRVDMLPKLLAASLRAGSGAAELTRRVVSVLVGKLPELDEAAVVDLAEALTIKSQTIVGDDVYTALGDTVRAGAHGYSAASLLSLLQCFVEMGHSSLAEGMLETVAPRVVDRLGAEDVSPKQVATVLIAFCDLEASEMPSWHSELRMALCDYLLKSRDAFTEGHPHTLLRVLRLALQHELEHPLIEMCLASVEARPWHLLHDPILLDMVRSTLRARPTLSPVLAKHLSAGESADGDLLRGKLDALTAEGADVAKALLLDDVLTASVASLAHLLKMLATTASNADASTTNETKQALCAWLKTRQSEFTVQDHLALCEACDDTDFVEATSMLLITRHFNSMSLGELVGLMSVVRRARIPHVLSLAAISSRLSMLHTTADFSDITALIEELHRTMPHHPHLAGGFDGLNILMDKVLLHSEEDITPEELATLVSRLKEIGAVPTPVQLDSIVTVCSAVDSLPTSTVCQLADACVGHDEFSATVRRVLSSKWSELPLPDLVRAFRALPSGREAMAAVLPSRIDGLFESTGDGVVTVKDVDGFNTLLRYLPCLMGAQGSGALLEPLVQRVAMMRIEDVCQVAAACVPATVRDHGLTRVCVDRVEQLMTQLPAQKLADVAESFSYPDHAHDDAMFDYLSREAATRVQDFDVQSLAKLLRAFARLSLSDKEEMLDSVCARLVAVLPTGLPSTIVDIVNSLNALHHVTPAALDCVAVRLASCSNLLTPRDIGVLGNVVSKVGYKNDALARTLCDRAAGCLKDGVSLKPAEVCAALAVLAMHASPANMEYTGDVAMELVEWINDVADTFEAVDVTSALSSFARTKIPSASIACVEPLLRRLEEIPADFSGSQLAEICFALARMNVRNESAMVSIADRLMDAPPVLGRDCVRVVHAYGRLRIPHRGVIAHMAQCLMCRATLGSLQVTDVTMALQGFGDAQHLDEAVMRELTSLAVKHAPRLNCIDLTAAISSVAKLRYHNEVFFGTMAARVIEEVEEFSIPHVTLILSSFARVAMSHDEMAYLLTQRIVEEIEDVDGRTCATVLVSLGLINYTNLDHWSVLADRIAEDVERLTVRNVEDLCDLCQRVNWRHEALLNALADQLTKLSETAHVSPPVARLLLDTLGIFLMNHAAARRILSPIASAASLENE
eukprot:PhM_4_TR11683/c0_g1_i1/m.76213